MGKIKKNLIILANSKREGGRCIAGICTDTGQWLRPIYKKDGKEAIPTSEVENIKLLDVVAINLRSGPNKLDSYQNENWFIKEGAAGNWQFIEKKSKNDMNNFCEHNPLILHNDNDKVSANRMEGLPFDEKRSLALIETEVKFEKHESKDRWQGVFEKARKIISLPVTDEAFRDELEADSNLRSGKYILTISLAKPLTLNSSYMNSPEYCYKLIAGVIY